MKGVVEENLSCMHDPAYQTYVTKRGESYNGITRIRSAIGSKGGTVGGKACGIIAATAVEKVKNLETFSESEQRVYDVKVMEGKPASIPRQFIFWSTKEKMRIKILHTHCLAMFGYMWQQISKIRMFVQKQHLQQGWINLLKKMERINCLQSI